MSDGSGVEPELPETLAVYLRLRGIRAPQRRRRRSVEQSENQPFTPGRDPHGLGDALMELAEQAGWQETLAKEELMLSWAELVGDETAQHSDPVSFLDGVLTVRCDSTAWATQLGLMRSRIMTEVQLRFPDSGVRQLRFLGPDVPSWKWGPRTVPGRGPRDTYG